MESWDKVAAYMAKRLAEIKGVDKIDLLTLNKVLYFAQRESYMKTQSPLFNEGMFHAAQYGPVILQLKKSLSEDLLTEMPDEHWLDCNRKLLEGVLTHYGVMSAHSLSTISHREISWRNARERATSSRYEPISDKDIRIDALKLRLRIDKLKAHDSRSGTMD